MLNARSMFSVVTLLVLIVTFVNGASTGSSSGVLTGLLLSRLYKFRSSGYAKRQDSASSGISINDFPPQCRSGCKVAVDTLNTCLLVSCLCTSAVFKSLQSCLNCSVEADPNRTVISDAQTVINDFNTLCADTGVGTLSLTATNPPSTTSTSTTSTSTSTSTRTSTSTSTSKRTSTTSTSPINTPITDLTPSSTPTISTTPALGPTTTITAVTGSSSGGNTGISTIIGNPSSTATKTSSDAVEMPCASKAYVTFGLVVAFFMCLA